MLAGKLAVFNSADADLLIPSSCCVQIKLAQAETAKFVPLST